MSSFAHSISYIQLLTLKLYKFSQVETSFGEEEGVGGMEGALYVDKIRG